MINYRLLYVQLELLVSDALAPQYADELDDMGMKNVQKKVKPEPMWEKTREILNQFYGAYNQKLASMLNDDSFLWKD